MALTIAPLSTPVLRPMTQSRRGAAVTFGSGASDAPEPLSPIEKKVRLFEDRLKEIEKTQMPPAKLAYVKEHGQRAIDAVRRGDMPLAVRELKNLMRVYLSHEQEIDAEFVATKDEEVAAMYLQAELLEQMGDQDAAKTLRNQAFDIAALRLGYRTPLIEGEDADRKAAV